MAIRQEIIRQRAELGLTRPFAFHARILGAPTRATLDPYEAAGFDSASITWDALDPEDPRETSLDHKKRALEKCARDLRLAPDFVR